MRKLVETIVKKINNGSFILELREVTNVLDALQKIPQVYEAEQFGLFNDTFWDEFYQWIRV